MCTRRQLGFTGSRSTGGEHPGVAASTGLQHPGAKRCVHHCLEERTIATSDCTLSLELQVIPVTWWHMQHKPGDLRASGGRESKSILQKSFPPLSPNCSPGTSLRWHEEHRKQSRWYTCGGMGGGGEEGITCRLPTPTPTARFSFNLLEPDCYLSMNPPATTQQFSLFGSVSFCGIMWEPCRTQPSHLLLHSGTSVAVCLLSFSWHSTYQVLSSHHHFTGYNWLWAVGTGDTK